MNAGKAKSHLLKTYTGEIDLMVAVKAVKTEEVWVYGPVNQSFIDEGPCAQGAFLYIASRAVREREHVLANRVGKRKAEKIAAGIVLKGCKKKQAANADPTKLRKTFQLSDAPVEQAMATDLYGSIPPSLWTQSRRNENPDGPFDAPPVLANERIYGVARLVGNGGYSTPKLHVSAVYSGADEAHCERQLVDELERALESSDVQRMGLTRDHRCELRVHAAHVSKGAAALKAWQLNVTAKDPLQTSRHEW